MSKLEELIQELCPNGVEYVALEKLCKTKTPPKKIQSNNIKEDGDYPVIDQGAKFISGFTNDEQALMEKNEYIIFGDHTESIKYIDFVFAQGADGIKILTAQDCDCRYLFHAFNCKYVKTGKYTRHWSSAKTTLIPLPPLPIQKEIVRILDNFTELTAELTAELVARKKQYEYYLNTFFKPSEKTQWKEMEEEFPFIRNGFVGTATPYYTNKDDGIRYLQGTNIHNGVISDNKSIFITREFHKKHIKNELKEVLNGI